MYGVVQMQIGELRSELVRMEERLSERAQSDLERAEQALQDSIESRYEILGTRIDSFERPLDPVGQAAVELARQRILLLLEGQVPQTDGNNAGGDVEFDRALDWLKVQLRNNSDFAGTDIDALVQRALVNSAGREGSQILSALERLRGSSDVTVQRHAREVATELYFALPDS